MSKKRGLLIPRLEGIHRKMFLYLFSLSFITGIIRILNQYLELYLRLRFTMTSEGYAIYELFLNLLLWIIYPLLIFVFFYVQGKKTGLRIKSKFIILTAFIGGYMGRLIGLIAMLSLIGGQEAIFTTALIQALNVLLDSFYLLLLTWSGMVLGLFRKEEEKQ